MFYWCVTFSISCDRFSISCTCYVFAILCLIFDPLIVHFRLVVHLTFLSLALKLYDKLSFFSVLFFLSKAFYLFFFATCGEFDRPFGNAEIPDFVYVF